MTLHTLRRFDGSVICEIDADTFRRAVEIAVERGIDLSHADFRGASLVGASLIGARLNGASLSHAWLNRAWLNGASLVDASLTGASLDGARLDGAKITDTHTITALIARATRIIKPYEFFLWETDKGDLITAGCHTMTIVEYRQYTDEYEDAIKREETLRLLDYFDACWAAYQKKGSGQ